MTPARLADVADRLPWPNVRGKRCADVSAEGYSLERELSARGAATVDHVEVASTGDRDALRTLESGVYDIVVASAVLHGAADPLDAARELRRVTRGLLVSCEPIDLWMSLLARGRGVFTIVDGAGDTAPRWAFNGGAQREVLSDAGFSIERVGRAFTFGEPVPSGGRRAAARRVALRLLTGDGGDGQLHRAVLARPAT
jgi:SAM-dependent methyltransferase